MNLNQLRFAIAVAASESFSQASKACFVTQPTLSNAIAQLEEQLGHKLFERTTRSVKLSVFGEQMIPKFEKLISESEGIINFAKSWQQEERETIRIGMSPVVNMMILQERLETFKQKHPSIDFYFQECFLDDLENRLKYDQLDFIIMPPRQIKLPTEQVHLYSESLYFVPSQKLEATTDDFYYLKHISNHKLVLTMDACGLRGVTQTLFEEHDCTVNEYPGQATSYSVVEDWAKVGIGSGVLPYSKISNSARAKPLMLSKDQNADISCNLYYRPEKEHKPHIEDFIQTIKQHAKIDL